MRLLIEQTLNQVLGTEVTDSLGAERYEGTSGRRTYRNGHRLGRLTTRDGSFSTELFGRYQPSEQALYPKGRRSWRWS